MLYLCVVIKSNMLLWLHLCHFCYHIVKIASIQTGDSLGERPVLSCWAMEASVFFVVLCYKVYMQSNGKVMSRLTNNSMTPTDYHM
jgi:hypothetical protein